MPGLKASVIIPTYGRPELAAAAAASALAQRLAGRFEVVVVDDGGADATRAALAGLKGLRRTKVKGSLVGRCAGAELHYLWKPHAGPAAARNHGAKHARGAALAFLDSDTVADRGWLAAGLKRLAAEGGKSGVEGRVLPMEDRPPTPFTEAVENRGGGRWLTCNLFVPRARFFAVGGFDERFPEPCREDSEFAFRFMEQGGSFSFEPKAVVRHPVREVPASRYFHHAREGRFEALIERRHPRLYRRHFKWLDGRALPAYYAGHYAAAALLPLSPPLAGAALAAGLSAVLFAWCRRRTVSLPAFGRLLGPALLAPYARLYWVLVGYVRHWSGIEKP